MEARQSSWWATFFGSLKSAFRFRGRATFSELVVYWLTVVLIVLMIELPLSFLLDFDRRMAAGDLLSIAAYLPVPSLIVRRLHDQNRSGHFLLLAVPGVALAISRALVSWKWGIDDRVQLDGYIWPVDWLATFTTLALIILMFLPGTPGANRFGPDPRDPAPEPVS